MNGSTENRHQEYKPSVDITFTIFIDNYMIVLDTVYNYIIQTTLYKHTTYHLGMNMCFDNRESLVSI